MYIAGCKWIRNYCGYFSFHASAVLVYVSPLCMMQLKMSTFALAKTCLGDFLLLGLGVKVASSRLPRPPKQQQLNNRCSCQVNFCLIFFNGHACGTIKEDSTLYLSFTSFFFKKLLLSSFLMNCIQHHRQRVTGAIPHINSGRMDRQTDRQS